MMYKIKFFPHNKEILVQEGTTLIRAAMEAGVHINASCGGEGVCGKCRVIIEKGEAEGGITERLTKEDIAKGYRQACLSAVKSDLTVRIPIESEVDASVLNMQATPRRHAGITEMNLDELKEQGLFIPPVEKKYLELPPPSISDNLPDVSRLVSFLKLNHDEHRLVVRLPVIRKIPDVLRKDNFRVTATIARSVQKGRKSHIINLQSGDTTEKNYAIAIDIGTTTVYGQLIDLKSGEVLAQFGDFNGQISYGEDVISRIMMAEKPGGLDKLQEVVVQNINNLIKKMIKRASIDPDDVSAISLAGNTTMTQLLLKINPKYMRRALMCLHQPFFRRLMLLIWELN